MGVGGCLELEGGKCYHTRHVSCRITIIASSSNTNDDDLIHTRSLPHTHTQKLREPVPLCAPEERVFRM